MTTNDEHIAAPLFYFGRYADGDGTFGSLQDQQIRIFDRSADGEFIVSRTFETNIPGGDAQFPLDIGFAGTDILVGGTITDLLVIKDDSNDNGVCVDTDGDGWGWNGTNSCQTQDIMPVGGDCIDSDGDGYGWNGVASCIVETTVCIDSDGDGWGWDGSASCLVSVPTDTIPESVYDSLPCIDNDGDGWGWQQPPGRPDAGRSCIVL